VSNSTRAAAHPIEVYVAGLLAVIDTDHGRMMPAHRNALPRQPLPGNGEAALRRLRLLVRRTGG
jgi:hypothetical protein